MVQVHVRAPLHATEVRERVETAVRAFWPNLELELAAGVLRGQSADLDTFRNHVWDTRIIDTTRGQMLHRCKGNKTSFWLSKQAALNGTLSFPPAPHALGEIDVELTVESGDKWADAEALVWWLCPETAEGEIVPGGQGSQL